MMPFILHNVINVGEILQLVSCNSLAAVGVKVAGQQFVINGMTVYIQGIMPLVHVFVYGQYCSV